MENQHFHKKVWLRSYKPCALWPLPPFILHSLPSGIFPSIAPHSLLQCDAENILQSESQTAMCCCLFLFCRIFVLCRTHRIVFSVFAPMLIVWPPVYRKNKNFDPIFEILWYKQAYHRLGIRSAIPVMPAMMLLWDIMTPFGIPVDPLVYMTTAMSEGRGGRRSHAAAARTETTVISRARELRRRRPAIWFIFGVTRSKNTHLHRPAQSGTSVFGFFPAWQVSERGRSLFLPVPVVVYVPDKQMRLED